MHESLLLQAYREYEWELPRFLGRRLGSATTRRAADGGRLLTGPAHNILSAAFSPR